MAAPDAIGRTKHERRDSWMFWSSPRDLRRRGYRMGPNRLRRKQRMDAKESRRVDVVLNQMGY